MRLSKCMYAVMLLIALLSWSCRSSKQMIVSENVESHQRTDSVSLLMEKITRPIVIPQATARMEIPSGSLLKLPLGANFQAKSGNATATITHMESGYEITANCDSLNVLVTDLRTEVYHLNQENTALKTNFKEQKTVGLSGWQWFQIYGFRILIVGLLIFLLWKFFISPKLGIITKFFK